MLQSNVLNSENLVITAKVGREKGIALDVSRVKKGLDLLAEKEILADKENKRLDLVLSLLSKVKNNVKINSGLVKGAKVNSLTEAEIKLLSDNIKYSDFDKTNFYVSKNGSISRANFSQNRVEFIDRNGKVYAKSIKLEILAYKYGSCINYLDSLKMVVSTDAQKGFNKAINDSALRISIASDANHINTRIAQSSLTTKIYKRALKHKDAPIKEVKIVKAAK
jgi:hypothetical protein